MLEDLDKINAEGVTEICPGFTVFRNKDDILCIILNYVAQQYVDLDAYNLERAKADQPLAKDKDEMYDQLAAAIGGKLSPKWLKEMENQFGAANKPLAAYHQFDYKFHTFHYPGIIPGATVHVSIDFGTDHTCVVVSQIETFTGFKRIHLHETIRGRNVNLATFLSNVNAHILNNYKNCEIKWYMVQEGKNREKGGIQDVNGAKSPLEVFYNMGIRPLYKYHHVEDGVNCVNNQLSRSIVHGIVMYSQDGLPIVTVNPGDMGLVDMLNGGYRKELVMSHKKQIKTANYHKDGEHDHVSDAMRPIFYIEFPIREIKQSTKNSLRQRRAPRVNM